MTNKLKIGVLFFSLCPCGAWGGVLEQAKTQADREFSFGSGMIDSRRESVPAVSGMPAWNWSLWEVEDRARGNQEELINMLLAALTKEEQPQRQKKISAALAEAGGFLDLIRKDAVRKDAAGAGEKQGRLVRMLEELLVGSSEPQREGLAMALGFAHRARRALAEAQVLRLEQNVLELALLQNLLLGHLSKEHGHYFLKRDRADIWVSASPQLLDEAARRLPFLWTHLAEAQSGRRRISIPQDKIKETFQQVREEFVRTLLEAAGCGTDRRVQEYAEWAGSIHRQAYYKVRREAGESHIDAGPIGLAFDMAKGIGSLFGFGRNRREYYSAPLVLSAEEYEKFLETMQRVGDSKPAPQK